MKLSLKIGFALFFISIYSQAQKIEITPQYGYQVGAKYSYNGGYIKMPDSGQFGLTIGTAISSSISAEFFWVQQNSTIRIKDVLFFPRETEVSNIRVNHYQFGVIHKFGNDKVIPFGGISAGQSSFNPDNGFSSSTKFSFGATGGVKYFFSDHIGFRLQAQLLIPIDWGGVYFGSGGTSISAGGSLVQLNFSGGLIFAFGK